MTAIVGKLKAQWALNPFEVLAPIAYAVAMLAFVGWVTLGGGAEQIVRLTDEPRPDPVVGTEVAITIASGAERVCLVESMTDERVVLDCAAGAE